MMDASILNEVNCAKLLLQGCGSLQSLDKDTTLDFIKLTLTRQWYMIYSLSCKLKKPPTNTKFKLDLVCGIETIVYTTCYTRK